MQQPAEDREALLVIDRRAGREPIVPIGVQRTGHVRAPRPREEKPDAAALPGAAGDPLIHEVLARIGELELLVIEPDHELDRLGHQRP